jgi:hypothetical protein
MGRAAGMAERRGADELKGEQRAGRGTGGLDDDVGTAVDVGEQAGLRVGAAFDGGVGAPFHGAVEPALLDVGDDDLAAAGVEPGGGKRADHALADDDDGFAGFGLGGLDATQGDGAELGDDVVERLRAGRKQDGAVLAGGRKDVKAGVAAAGRVDALHEARAAAAGDEVADLIGLHFFAELDDFADDGVAGDERLMFRAERAQLGAGGDGGVEGADDDVLGAAGAEVEFLDGDLAGFAEDDGGDLAGHDEVPWEIGLK